MTSIRDELHSVPHDLEGGSHKVATEALDASQVVLAELPATDFSIALKCTCLLSLILTDLVLNPLFLPHEQAAANFRRLK